MQQNPAENQDKTADVQTEPDEGTRAFSRRLNAAKEKWRAEYEQHLFDRLKLSDPATGAPITNADQLIALLEQMDSVDDTLRPDAEAENPEMAELRAQLARYRDSEEDQQLAQDARRGDDYRRLRGEVKQLADYARGQGKALSLTAAFRAVLLEHLDELLEQAGTRSEQSALERMRANAVATPSALGGETAGQKTDYGRMSEEEFDRVLQMALNGDLKRS